MPRSRLVYMNSATITALQAWLAIRGDAEYLSDHVFVYRHQPLTRRYCGVRLRTYGKRCATLLLNAGAPVLSVQSLLGHEKVDNTLGYARLYDSTVAADYYRAIGQIERLIELPENQQIPLSAPTELVALVDSLNSGTLSEYQREMVQALREGIISLTTKEGVNV